MTHPPKPCRSELEANRTIIGCFQLKFGVAKSRYERDEDVSGDLGAGRGEKTDNSVNQTENHTLNQQRLKF